jgi:hypothetical protein
MLGTTPKQIAGAVALLAAAPLLSACSSAPSFPSIGAIPTFGSASKSVIDQTFLGAAQTWDFDKNGVVTCDEWKNYISTSVRESDGDGNGSLDASEFTKMAQNDRLFEVADLKYYDSNGDGRASLEEITGKPNVAFKMLDKNGDCQIDRNETVQIISRDKEKDTSNAPNQEQVSRRGGGGY